ncbi:MAG: phosphotransferase [Caldilineaceae bacterium]
MRRWICGVWANKWIQWTPPWCSAAVAADDSGAASLGCRRADRHGGGRHRGLLQPLAELDLLLDRVVEARFSTIHGDLNLNNVLVDMATGFAWLIDFADTRHGPTLYDLQRLEVQVIIKLLPALFAQESARPVAQQMAALASLLDALHADPPSPLAPDQALQEPYVLLTHIRRLARQYLMDDLEWDEYYWGLTAALIGALKFDELAEQTRCLILTAAATVQKLLGVTPRRSHAVTIATAAPHALVAAPHLGVIASMRRPCPRWWRHQSQPIRRVDNFVGRDAELTAYAERLQAQRFAAISGMAGVGKTALAAVLTDWVATPEKVFWHSFHEGDGINTIIWKLAAFLAHHGAGDLWRLLETAPKPAASPRPQTRSSTICCNCCARRIICSALTICTWWRRIPPASNFLAACAKRWRIAR